MYIGVQYCFLISIKLTCSTIANHYALECLDIGQQQQVGPFSMNNRYLERKQAVIPVLLLTACGMAVEADLERDVLFRDFIFKSTKLD